MNRYNKASRFRLMIRCRCHIIYSMLSGIGKRRYCTGGFVRIGRLLCCHAIYEAYRLSVNGCCPGFDIRHLRPAIVGKRACLLNRNSGNLCGCDFGILTGYCGKAVAVLHDAVIIFCRAGKLNSGNIYRTCSCCRRCPCENSACPQLCFIRRKELSLYCFQRKRTACCCRSVIYLGFERLNRNLKLCLIDAKLLPFTFRTVEIPAFIDLGTHIPCSDVICCRPDRTITSAAVFCVGESHRPGSRFRISYVCIRIFQLNFGGR